MLNQLFCADSTIYRDSKRQVIDWVRDNLTRKNETLQSILVNKYNLTFISDKTAFNSYIGNEYIMVNNPAVIRKSNK